MNTFLCNFWWLLWLLPLLIGALLWWRQKNKYDHMVSEYNDRIKGLNGRISALEDELSACKSKRAELEGDLAITKGRMREMEAEMNRMRDESSTTSNLGAAGLGALASSKGAEGKGNDAAKSNDTKNANADSSDMGSDSSAGGDDPASSLSSALDGGGVDTSSAGLGAIASSLAGSTGKGGAAGGASSIYAKVKSDNLQIIEGIGPKMESVLKENGIDNHKTLGSKSFDELRAILDKYGDKYKIIDPKTWPDQAKMAGDGDFDGLISFQKKLDAGKDNAVGMTASKLEKYLIKIGAIKAFKQDDLKAIEGIGPATDKLLRANGINTWRELANTSADKIQEILTAAGSRFSLGDPTTWPKQAELAADGKFDELREYQDFLDGGKA